MKKEDEIGKIIIQSEDRAVFKILSHRQEVIAKDVTFDGWNVFDYQTQKETIFDRDDQDTSYHICAIDIPENQLQDHARMINEFNNLHGEIDGNWQAWVSDLPAKPEK